MKAETDYPIVDNDFQKGPIDELPLQAILWVIIGAVQIVEICHKY